MDSSTLVLVCFLLLNISYFSVQVINNIISGGEQGEVMAVIHGLPRIYDLIIVSSRNEGLKILHPSRDRKGEMQKMTILFEVMSRNEFFTIHLRDSGNNFKGYDLKLNLAYLDSMNLMNKRHQYFDNGIITFTVKK